MWLCPTVVGPGGLGAFPLPWRPSPRGAGGSCVDQPNWSVGKALWWDGTSLWVIAAAVRRSPKLMREQLDMEQETESDEKVICTRLFRVYAG